MYYIIFRLLSRIIFIPFDNAQRSISDEEASLWQQMFDCLIEKVSSVVGKVIALGEWVLTQEGRDLYNECLGIVLKGFGEEGRGTRFSKMGVWTFGRQKSEFLNFYLFIFAIVWIRVLYKNQEYQCKEESTKEN